MPRGSRLHMLMFMCCIRLLHAFALPLHSQAGEDPNAPNFLVTAKQLLQTPAFLPPLAAFVASIGVSNVVSATFSLPPLTFSPPRYASSIIYIPRALSTISPY